MASGNPAEPRPLEGGVAAAKEVPGAATPSGWTARVTSLLGLMAAWSALIYALGYLTNLGRLKMLGVWEMDYSADRIIFHGCTFPFMAVVCALAALSRSPLAWALLLLGAAAALRRLWPDRVSRVTTVFLRIVETVALILSPVLFFFLSMVIAEQMGVLVGGAGPPDQSTRSFFRWLTSHDAHLVELIRSGAGRTLYGVLFLLGAVCCLCWTALLVWTVRRWRSARAAAQARRTTTRLGLAALGCFLVVTMVAVLLPMLYGFLAVANECPVIDLKGDRPAGLPPGEFYVLGKAGTRMLLYSDGYDKIWWVWESALPPVAQGESRSLFEKPGETDAASR
jgi:hypothetical protein